MNKKLNERLKKKKKGFTLVELVIVIAIIAILAAMALPKFGAARTDAKVSDDIAAAKNIQTTVARLVANGTIKEDTSATVSAGDQVAKLIDGSITPKAKAGNFTYKVLPNGDVEVYSDQATSKIAPADDNTVLNYRKETGIDK